MKSAFQMGLLALAMMAVGEASGNSYGFIPIPKSDLPASVHAFSIWSFPYPDLDYVVTQVDLERFLTKGNYSYNDPFFEERRISDVRSLLKTPESQLTAEGREALGIHKKHRWFTELGVDQNLVGPSIKGAFTDEAGRIFQFQVRSNRSIEIISRGICYLTLTDEDAIHLKKREAPSQLSILPKLPEDQLALTGGPLPGVNYYDAMPVSLLRSFFEEGKVTTMTPKERHQHPSTKITTFWLADSETAKSRHFKIRSTDKAGNGILPTTVNGVFRFGADQLWTCTLYSDALLFVDDGKGNYAVIEHPAAMTAKAGQVEPLPMF